MEVVWNGDIYVLVIENFKQMTECDEFDKILHFFAIVEQKFRS